MYTFARGFKAVKDSWSISTKFNQDNRTNGEVIQGQYTLSGGTSKSRPTAGKVCIFTFTADGDSSDFAVNVTVKYHLR